MGNKIDKIKELQNEYNYLKFSGNILELNNLKKKYSEFAKHRGLHYLIQKYSFLFISHKKVKYINPLEMAEMIKEGYLLPEYHLINKYSYFTLSCKICGEYPAKTYLSSRKPVSEINLCEKCCYKNSPLKELLKQNYEKEILEKLICVLVDFYEVPLVDFKNLNLVIPLNKFEEFARIKDRNFEKEYEEEFLPEKFFRAKERKYIRLIHTLKFKEFIKKNPNPSFSEVVEYCELF